MDASKRINADFSTQGFAVIPDLLSKEEVVQLAQAYDEILNGEVECGELDRNLGGLTRQVMMPHLLHSAFRDTQAIKRAQLLACELTQQAAPTLNFSMLIYKPPEHPHPTPWHQDMAYLKSPFTPTGAKVPNHAIAQFWLALDDVDESMGCMEFIPGVQTNPMPEHYVASGDPKDSDRLLAMVDPEHDLDLSQAVKCPINSGSATVHGYATPHYTGPNRSTTRGRRAFIFSFANEQALSKIGRSHQAPR